MIYIRLRTYRLVYTATQRTHLRLQDAQRKFVYTTDLSQQELLKKNINTPNADIHDSYCYIKNTSACGCYYIDVFAKPTTNGAFPLMTSRYGAQRNSKGVTVLTNIGICDMLYSEKEVERYTVSSIHKNSVLQKYIGVWVELTNLAW